LAAFNANEIKQAGTLGPYFTTVELVAWANDGKDRLEKVLRRVNENYFIRFIASTGTSAKILGIDYAGTSLAWADGTILYTLPPDFLKMVSIRITTSAYANAKIERRAYHDPEFQDALRTSNTAQIMRGADFFYDIIGERTLAIAPDPNAALNLEMAYVARTRKLVRYVTGTLSVPDASNAVTGAGTIWSSGTPFDASYLDIIFGNSASATEPTPNITSDYNGVEHARVAAITSDTALTLASNKVGTLAAGTGYILSSVPQAPSEHHPSIADYVAGRMLMKRGSGHAKNFLDVFEANLGAIQTDVAVRGVTDIELPKATRGAV